MAADEHFQSFYDRYDSGHVPWDDPLPPPEVLALVDTFVPGRALDLGSGYGRSAIYLAQHGWLVDAVEFVPGAVAESILRAAAAGVSARTTFHVGDVSRLDFLAGPYEFALDIGCMHSLGPADLVAYRDGLLRLVSPGGLYLLFAHLRDMDDSSAEAGRWIAESEMQALFAHGFVLEDAVLGTTQVADNPPWQSGWFYFRRAGA